MERLEKPAAAKKIERIAYISFAIIAVFIIAIIIITKVKDKKFLNEGIRVEATVNGLYEGGTNKSKTHTMTISMFTKGQEKPREKSDTIGKSEGDKKLDAILDKITINPNIGNYLRLTINCSIDSYNKYKPGDKLTVVYLKEDSSDVRILSELE